MTDGYGAYRRGLVADVAARAEEMDDVEREMLDYAAELETTNPGLWLGAGRIAHEMVLHSLRRRSSDPMERALQAEVDRQARALERRIISGGLT